MIRQNPRKALLTRQSSRAVVAPVSYRSLCVAALGLLAFCARANGACTMGVAADLPLTSDHRSYVADVGINGRSAHMLVDTGSFFSVLAQTSAKRLGLHAESENVQSTGVYVVSHRGDYYLEGLGAGWRASGVTTASNVQIGGANGSRFEFLIVDQSAIPTGVDGLLGMNIIARYDDDLDLAHRHLRLVQTQGDCHVPVSPLGSASITVKLLDDKLQSPIITVSINGIALRAGIDTGSKTSIIFRSAAERIGLPAAQLLASQKEVVQGVGPQPVRGAITRLQLPIEIGDLSIDGLPIEIADQPRVGGADMLLGYEFVTLVHLWISHSSNTLIMQYPAQPTPISGR
jgi:predicted aspartyl protease